MDMNEYQRRAMTTRNYPDTQRISYPALGLGGEVGEVLDQIKRIFRDDGGHVLLERQVKIAQEAGDVLWYLAALLTDCGMHLSVVAQGNLEKLASRQERGVIKGEGGDR